MQVRLEKINSFKPQRRFHALSTSRAQFGVWCLIREWGRIGTAGGQKKVDYLGSEEAAECALARIKGATRQTPIFEQRAKNIDLPQN